MSYVSHAEQEERTQSQESMAGHLSDKYFSIKEPEFNPQHSHLAMHICLYFQLQKDLMPLASENICTHMHIPAHMCVFVCMYN